MTTACRRHLALVFGWSNAGPVDWPAAVSAGLGMAGPVLLGLVSGHASAGLAGGLGGLLAEGVGSAGGAAGRRCDLVRVAAPLAAATITACLAAGHGGVTDIAVALAAGAAALAGGCSRAAAGAATRFVLFLVIVAAAADTVAVPDGRAGLAALTLAGAVWAAFVSLALGAIVRAKRGLPVPLAPTGRGARPTAGRGRERWCRSLVSVEGWQYPLRLTLCLAAAGGLKAAWADHHMHWVALTVALLIERPVEAVPVRTVQRALGTTAGLLIAGLLPDGAVPAWLLVPGLGLLAAARPVLRPRSYLAYAAVMTPLVLVVMDGGGAAGAALPADRLAATLAGVALVVAANAVTRRIAGVT